MKTTNLIISSLAAFSLLAVSAVSVNAAETEKPAGYVTIAAEKFTLGQDFLASPEQVPYYAGDTGVDIAERFFGKENINGGSGVGSYMTSLKDNGEVKADIPGYILEAVKAAGDEAIKEGRSSEGWLTAGDYYSMSGWMYAVNNESAAFGLSDYTPADGDVIRFEFSVYGYGSDIGFDNSSWGGSASLTQAADRDELYKNMAMAKTPSLYNDEGVKAAYADAAEIASDLLADQDKINAAAALIEEAVAHVQGEVTTTSAVTTSAEASETTVSKEKIEIIEDFKADETTTAQTTEATTTTTTAATTTVKASSTPATGEKSVTALVFAGGAALAACFAAKRRK